MIFIHYVPPQRIEGRQRDSGGNARSHGEISTLEGGREPTRGREARLGPGQSYVSVKTTAHRVWWRREHPEAVLVRDTVWGVHLVRAALAIEGSKLRSGRRVPEPGRRVIHAPRPSAFKSASRTTVGGRFFAVVTGHTPGIASVVRGHATLTGWMSLVAQVPAFSARGKDRCGESARRWKRSKVAVCQWHPPRHLPCV